MAVTGRPHTDRTVNEIFDQLIASPIVTTVATAIAIALVALWLAAAWWAYTDAARRTDNTLAALLAAAWITVSTPFLVPLSLAIYALARPQHTAAEHRTRRLAADLVDQLEDLRTACSTCRAEVDPGWRRCPDCATWLARPCAGCGVASARELAVCPFCGSDAWAEPAIETTSPAATPARARRARRRARAVGPAGSMPLRHGQRKPVLSEPRAAAPLAVRS